MTQLCSGEKRWALKKNFVEVQNTQVPSCALGVFCDAGAQEICPNQAETGFLTELLEF